MNPEEQVKSLEEQPGLRLAYEFVIPSYQWTITRSEAVHARIQNLLGFAAALTVGAPVFGRAIWNHLSANSTWFILAAGAFVLTAVVGLVASRLGDIVLMDPAALCKEWLVLSEADFRRNAVEWAGKHFDESFKWINRKGIALKVMTLLFLAETGFLVVWIVFGQ